jgi:hypothetical protein
MPPSKKTTSEDDTSLADIARLIKSQGEQIAALSTKMESQGEQMAALSTKMDKVDKIESDVSNLRTLIVALREENKELKSQVKEKDRKIEDMGKSIAGLEDKLNSVEQHHRGWGARVLNVKVSDAEAADPAAMIKKVFDLALRPILEGAVRAGKLSVLPPANQVLEIAHVLPGRPGVPRPIIMRFFSRNVRSLCFQFKKDFAPRETEQRGGGQQVDTARKGRFVYPLYDDLTKPTLLKMRAIQQDDRVLACWTVNGRIHFRMKDSEVVRKVVSIQDPLDEILK